ncbi:MAG: NUDIX hydrolase [Patescibacteria group bacterium]
MHTTVKNEIFDSLGRVLLVHERGDSGWEYNNGKKPGWGLPGGGVESEENIADIYKEIMILLKQGHIFKQEVLIYIPKNDRYILAAIREALEETGFLVQIERELFREEYSRHAVITYKSKIIDGVLKKNSPETDDAGWFSPDALPGSGIDLDFSKAIYPSDKRRVLRAVEELKYEAQYLDWYLRNNSGKEVFNAESTADMYRASG